MHNDCQLDIVRFQPYGEQRDEAGEKCLNCGLNESQKKRQGLWYPQLPP